MKVYLLSFGGALLLSLNFNIDTASAFTCYAQVGGACLKKSYGSLDSTCANDCAVGLYVFKDTNGKRRVAGGGLTDSVEVIAGKNGSRPAVCPNGAFYEGAAEQIRSCEDDVKFNLKAASSKNKGFAPPEGALVLELEK